MNKAKDFVFTMLDMDIMYNENCRAYNEYRAKMDSNISQQEKDKMIAVEEFQSLKDYYKKVLKRLAHASHGDVVLMDNGKEVLRYKACYK